jgi:hypothetical protein
MIIMMIMMVHDADDCRYSTSKATTFLLGSYLDIREANAVERSSSEA